MKKNKNIRNLETEKLRLRVKQLELEKQIRRDWKELKEDLSPRNLIEHKLEAFTNKKTGGSLLFDLINFGVSHFSKQF
ncbi:MAG: hypothetical protein E6H07_17915 [Bacteroidetes bacterium]|nr:MAG: hypothetical protein E6H07_17915 [Bacteroidota bacterium]